MWWTRHRVSQGLQRSLVFWHEMVVLRRQEAYQQVSYQYNASSHTVMLYGEHVHMFFTNSKFQLNYIYIYIKLPKRQVVIRMYLLCFHWNNLLRSSLRLFPLCRKFRSSREPERLSGTALGCELDDRGFDSRQGLEIFLLTTASRRTLWPTQPPIQWIPGDLSMGVKRPGCQADHSPPSSA
jgi:hypothetical protein